MPRSTARPPPRNRSGAVGSQAAPMPSCRAAALVGEAEPLDGIGGLHIDGKRSGADALRQATASPASRNTVAPQLAGLYTRADSHQLGEIDPLTAERRAQFRER